MTPSFNVLLSWNFTILVIIGLPSLWKYFSWRGVVGGLSIALIVAVLVAASDEALDGDPWSRSQSRTLKMFLGDVMYVVFGPLLFLLPALLFGAIISPIFVLVALWKYFSWKAVVILLLSILILVGVVAVFNAANKPLTDLQLLGVIKKAAVKKKRELAIRDRQLKRLPPEIGQLTNLTSLDLKGNDLRNLPPEIGQLTNLTSLDLEVNELSSLPTEIGQLTNLSELGLQRNNLKQLPPEIGELKKLDSLDLEANKLSSLPPEIGQLTNLSKLILNRNNLTILPPEIGQLTNLSYLWIDDSIMAGYAAKLEKQRDIFDKRNQLTSLPPEIGKLTKLSQLRIDKNLLKSLPPEIGKLTKLTSLDISRNKLRSLPSEIGELTNINSLYISGNELTSLPPEIGKLTKLTSLDISENKLTILPSQIGELTELTYLNISGNSLALLPSEIIKLTNLTLLRISHNEVKSLPVEIIEMIQLDLYVNGVMLTGRYKKIHPARWRTEWLLSEGNAELRRLLIQVIGYERICQELRATELDTWGQYTLLTIDDRVDVEKICLLKMTCPSTGYIYAIRVPPDLESAREAIKWVNWGIDPEEFSVQT